VCVGETPVPSSLPSPKSQLYVRLSLSGSELPLASNSHVSPLQSAVNSAVGASLVGTSTSPGATTTESITVRVTAALVVAVRPAAVPVATASFESPRTPLTFPVPVAAAVVREVVSDGNVQVRGSVDDFSVQIETSQLFSFSTATVGAVWLEVDVVPAPTSDATTVAWAVLR
jgi:hypothetical protein